jgi:hypothetical protein
MRISHHSGSDVCQKSGIATSSPCHSSPFFQRGAGRFAGAVSMYTLPRSPVSLSHSSTLSTILLNGMSASNVLRLHRLGFRINLTPSASIITPLASEALRLQCPVAAQR